MVTDINECIHTGQWVGDCFIYTNSTNRLNYLVGDQTYTVSHFDQPMYLIGYLPRDGRIYIADKDVSVSSYALSLSVVEYQTLVLRGDLDTAAELLTSIPDDQKNKIARFLEGQGQKELALEVATDLEHRFDLALSLNNLPIALEITRAADVEHRWKTVGDAAMAAWDVSLAEECFIHAKDLSSLLLVYTATCNTAGLRTLVQQAEAAGLHNIAFSCLWYLADVDGCIDLLARTNRHAEAVFFTQTYKPSRAIEVVKIWKEGLEKDGKGRIAKSIAVPPGEGEDGDDPDFPHWQEYLQLERDEGVMNSSVSPGKEEGLNAEVDDSNDVEDEGGAA